MRTRDDLIEKVRKLRALQQSSNLHEAENATRAVERLIQEHQLAEAEIEATAQQEVAEACAEDPDFLVQWRDRKTNWIVNLTFRLARAYQCDGVMTHKFDSATRTTMHGVLLTGRPSDVAIVRAQLAYLVVEIRRLCELDGLKGKAARTSFCMGAVDGLYLAIRETQREARREATSTALAVIDDRLVKASEVLKRNHPRIRTVSTRAAISNANAYNSGRRAGESIHTGSSLGSGGNGPRRLGS
jgi:hypothetical protein